MAREYGEDYWAGIHATVAYADFLRHDGDPYSSKARKLRHNAFDGPCIQLNAMHKELVDPRWLNQPAPKPTKASKPFKFPDNPSRIKPRTV